jgi:hypothetical protein
MRNFERDLSHAVEIIRMMAAQNKHVVFDVVGKAQPKSHNESITQDHGGD